MVPLSLNPLGKHFSVKFFYFHTFYVNGFEPKTFDQILKILILQAESSINIEGFIIIQLFTTAFSIFRKQKCYHRLPEVIKAAKKLMLKNQDFQRKPIVDLVEGTYWLFEKGDEEKGFSFYEKGLIWPAILAMSIWQQ